MRRAWTLGVLLALALGAAVGFGMWRQRQPGVEVTLDPAFPALGRPPRTVHVALRARAGRLARLEAHVVQAGVARPVASEDLSALAAQTARRPLTLDAAALQLREGPAELRVFARDGLWRPRPDPGPRLVHRFRVDLTPPTLELRAATGYVSHAGSGLAVYRTTGATRSGVGVGSAFFPGTAGLAEDPTVHVALFAIPHDAPPAPPVLVAEDEAGNQRTTGLPVTLLPTRFPKDSLQLTEGFLRRKVPELDPATPADASPRQLLEAFLRVNREGRQAAERRIRDLTRAGSAPRPLWQGPFRQQPNTRVFANFPEERTYRVDGEVVDTQWHLGIDLASVRRSPVEAAAAGRVVFTGPNGIYGNMVVLDHGLGLFSLYAHLSEIAVQPGQEVAQGQVLGRSGETGLAGGDHLHFALLVHGVYVTPLEWWDPHWLRDRIARPLREAGLQLPELTERLPPEPATPRRRPAARR